MQKNISDKREKASRYHSWLRKLDAFYAAPIAVDPDNPEHPADNKVPPRGDLNSPVMVFAGSPDKKSFLAGQALKKSKTKQIAKKLGFEEEDLFYAYTVPSFSDKRITQKDIKAYRPLIKDLIWIVEPKYILPTDDLARKMLEGITNIPKIISLKDLDKIKEKFQEKSDAMRRENAWDIVRELPGEVKVRDGYIVICGSLPDKRSDVDDIDLHVVDSRFDPAIEKEIKKRMSSDQKGKLQFFNQSRPPTGNRIVIYDLLLRKRKSFPIIKSDVNVKDIIGDLANCPQYKKTHYIDTSSYQLEGIILEEHTEGERVWVLKENDHVAAFDIHGKPASISEEVKRELSNFSRNFIIECVYTPPLLHAVDILYHQTADIRHLKLIERKHILGKAISEKGTEYMKLPGWEKYQASDLNKVIKGKSGAAIKPARSVYSSDVVWFVLPRGFSWADKVRSRADDKKGMNVQFFKKYEPLKSGGKEYSTGSFQSWQAFWKTWASGYIDDGIFVEKKVDGIRCVIEKKGDRIEIYSEGWQRMTKTLPSVVKSVKDWDTDEFIMEGELVEFDKNGNPKHRTVLDDFLQPPAHSDKNCKILYFDILWLNGENVTGRPYRERRNLYKKIVDDAHAEVVSGQLCENKKELKKAIAKYAQQVGSEGAYCKAATAAYSEDDSVLYAKVKNFKELKALAIGKRKQEGADAYQYMIAFKENGQVIPFRTQGEYTKNDIKELRNEGWEIASSVDLREEDQEIQKTFASGLDAKLKDVITVRFEEILEFKVDDTTYYSVQKPLPTDISERGKVWGLKMVKKAVEVGTGPLNLF